MQTCTFGCVKDQTCCFPTLITQQQVDTVLFRVHSHFFLRESAFWKKELLSGPNAREDEPFKQGNSSSDPVKLVNEKPGDFARFLWVFYNMYVVDFGDLLDYSNIYI